MLYSVTLLSNLEEALQLAVVRNECRHFLTNDQTEITVSGQTRWYNEIYAKQCPQKYWVWLLKETNVIGYFAAKEGEKEVYITEGLLEEKRGIGLGSFLLDFMLSPHFFPGKPVIAEIYTHNIPSIRLHKKFKFREFGKNSDQIARYILC